MSFIRLTVDDPVARQGDTPTGALVAMGARFVMHGDDAEGRFGLIEHPIIPRGLACPLHLHTREDEYSFVLEGRWGFRLGDRVVYGDDLGAGVWRSRCLPLSGGSHGSSVQWLGPDCGQRGAAMPNELEWFRRFGDIPGVEYTPLVPVDVNKLRGATVLAVSNGPEA